MNQISDNEYVNFVIYYNNLGKDKPKADLSQRGYTKEMLKQLNDLSLNVCCHKVLNVEYPSSLRNEYPGFGFLYNLYRQYSDNGTMPYPGCLTEQPAKIIEYFDIFDCLKAEAEKEQMRKMKKNG